MATRIVVADDHTLFRSSLRKLLEEKPQLQIVGEAASGSEALEVVRELRPDILFLDVCLPDLSGLDVLKQLDPACECRVVLLTAGIEHHEVIQAFKQGARGILLKDSTTSAVFDSIETLMSGRYCVYGNAVPKLTEVLRNLTEHRSVKARTPRFNLTRRELDVIRALTSGNANRQIAKELAISEQTVKHHVTNIFNKTGTSTRLELTILAVRQGLLVE